MTTDPNAPEHFAPQPPPPSGGGSKVWLFLGLGCGVMLLLCCGGLVGSSIYLGKNAIQIAQDPEAAKQQGGQIADFDLPQGFNANSLFTLKNPLSGEAVMSTVIYTGPSNEQVIVLMDFGKLMANADREQMRTQMEQQMQQQGRQMKNLNMAESRDVQVEIRGQPATFKIQKGEEPNTKQEFVQVEGFFEGKRGPAMFVGRFKADNFTEDDAEKLVRSIK